MKYYKQLIDSHDPENGIYGDCFRTAVACILDKKPEEVPHVFSLEDDSLQDREMRVYLETIGYLILHTAFNIQPLETMLEYGHINMPGQLWILGGVSSQNNNHAVVCRNHKMIHDPHPCNEFLSGPSNDGYWHVYVIARPI